MGLLNGLVSSGLFEGAVAGSRSGAEKTPTMAIARIEASNTTQTIVADRTSGCEGMIRTQTEQSEDLGKSQ